MSKYHMSIKEAVIDNGSTVSGLLGENLRVFDGRINTD